VLAGTHVAGIITAKNSNTDPTVESVVGISPGTPIFSLKVLDAKGRGSMSNMLSAVQWVLAEGLQQGIRVINLSLAAYVDPNSQVCCVFSAVTVTIVTRQVLQAGSAAGESRK
jgi:subtilisin/minor extracellular protease Epr